MDSLASLALATEPPTPELLNRPPYSKDDYIISRKMVKHILLMSLWQILIVYSIVFAGEFFFPEPDALLRFDQSDKFVYPGRLYDWDGVTPLWAKYQNAYGASRHMTNVFNIFTVMQIFNLVCARMIQDEINIFKRVFKNLMFCGVFLGICVAHVFII
jgi:Ca2+ transporting ATPase